MRAFALAIPLTTLLGAVCFAQEPGPIIENTGKASVEIVPEEIAFVVSSRYREASTEAGNQRATAMRRALEGALNDLDLQPLRVSPVRLSLEGLTEPFVTAEVDLIFAATDGRGALITRDALAALAERLRKLAVASDMTVRFKELGVASKDESEQEAVARATENALYLANAVAALINAQVAEVRRVTIEDVQWSGLTPEPGDRLVWPPEIRCAAHVEVEYLYEFSTGR